MKDYDIKIRNGNEIKVYGTDNDTIVVPSRVRFDTARGHADIDINGESDVTVGLPSAVEKIELNIDSASLTLKDMTFDEMEIDAKGKITIAIENLTGPIDINMVGGEAELIVPAGYQFTTRCEGKGNSIDCSAPTTDGASNVIELNGKNSTLKISAR